MSVATRQAAWTRKYRGYLLVISGDRADYGFVQITHNGWLVDDVTVTQGGVFAALAEAESTINGWLNAR